MVDRPRAAIGRKLTVERGSNRPIAAEEKAQALVKSSATFSAKYKSLGDPIQYLKQESVALYEREYAEVEHTEHVADGVLHVPIWKDVGATYCTHLTLPEERSRPLNS